MQKFRGNTLAMVGIPRGSLFFAPMEGITDENYRLSTAKCFPGWDYWATDFLRVPSQGLYTENFIMKHLGNRVANNQILRSKTQFQILTSPNAHTGECVRRIQNLGISWLDLNLGCPSRTVIRHQGGSYLLTDLVALRKIVKNIRENFKKTFSAKIRVGFSDDSLLIDILKLLEDEGVELVTIHGRTRDQLYKGRANWSYIKEAVKAVKIPIIGNGDIWTKEDIEKIYHETSCYGVMMARGALKTPWMPLIWKENLDPKEAFYNNLVPYFRSTKDYLPEVTLLKRWKAYCRYTFEDLPEGELWKRFFLRAKTVEEFEEYLERVAREEGPPAQK